jgi:hypothetical protein
VTETQRTEAISVGNDVDLKKTKSSAKKIVFNKKQFRLSALLAVHSQKASQNLGCLYFWNLKPLKNPV